MEKECNVVMLSTDKETNLFWREGDGLFYSDCSPQTAHSINSSCKGYSLHITSNEEIKEGDWYFSFIGREVRKATKEDIHQIKVSNKAGFEPVRFKIIATTDTSLKILIGCEESTNDNMEEPTPIYKLLPQIPQSFIDTFIEEYNKDNVIDKVMVEYQTDWNKETIMCMEGNGDNPDDFPYTSRFKIDKNNTINISLTENKDIFTFEEVRSIIDQFICEECPEFSSKGNGGTYLHKWIKENLK